MTLKISLKSTWQPWRIISTMTILRSTEVQLKQKSSTDHMEMAIFIWRSTRFWIQREQAQLETLIQLEDLFLSMQTRTWEYWLMTLWSELMNWLLMIYLRESNRCASQLNNLRKDRDIHRSSKNHRTLPLLLLMKWQRFKTLPRKSKHLKLSTDRSRNETRRGC